jgi:autophagy-related protein 11
VLHSEEAYEAFSATGQRELEDQAVLLSSLELDLDMISRIAIHLDFLGENMRRAIEAGDRPRTLGDYVSKEKMRQVALGCSKLHGA